MIERGRGKAHLGSARVKLRVLAMVENAARSSRSPLFGFGAASFLCALLDRGCRIDSARQLLRPLHFSLRMTRTTLQ
jgi:hypothetical protein